MYELTPPNHIHWEEVEAELERLGFEWDRSEHCGHLFVKSPGPIAWETLANSPLAERGGVLNLHDRLFSIYPPEIDLGGDVFVGRDVDWYSSGHYVVHREEGTRGQRLFRLEKTEDYGDLMHGCKVSWHYRTDLGLDELAVILADSYRELGTDEGRELMWATGRSWVEEGDKPYEETEVALPDNDQLRDLIAEMGRYFNSLSFRGGILTCSIYGHVGEYSGENNTVVVEVPRDSPVEDLGSWIHDLMDKTSFMSDPKYAHLGEHIKKLGNEFGPKLLTGS